MPKFIEFVEKELTANFFLGNDLKLCDYWAGCIYTNLFTNTAVSFGKEQWAEALTKCPKFDAFGKKFTTLHEDWLKKRPSNPM